MTQDAIDSANADKQTGQTSSSPSLSNLQASTIEGVIKSLDLIVSWSLENNKRTGYFAALYRKVTIRVKEGIEEGKFDDAARMEKLDVIFANRYLEAFEQYITKQPMTSAWQLAFDKTEKWEPIVFQHLMLGMNAHINLDLGIAAAQTTVPEDLPQLKNDFDKINALLGSMVNETQNELSEIWPAFKYIDKFSGSLDESIADISMKIARNLAWKVAEEYSQTKEDCQDEFIKTTDCAVRLAGSVFSSPGWRLRLVMLAIRLTERTNVAKTIQILS